MGVHTPEEVSQFGCADLKVLSDILADKPFFFGDEPTTVNFCLVTYQISLKIAVKECDKSHNLFVIFRFNLIYVVNYPELSKLPFDFHGFLFRVTLKKKYLSYFAL